MMNAIEVDGLSKLYRIYANPMDRLKESILRHRRSFHQEFWALHDVSFRVRTGSAVGFIGDNGAGKSTVLHLIAGTLQPTAGRIAVNGRVSAILELGTGFNPEFTGRENAMLSGAIMGVEAREMKRRFPEIAAFADIGEFIDRPVKLYSSGMYVRLAFAVATSVDPEILIIDEALAVGDQFFQKRCIDRIAGFQKKGKTILFCSHNLYQVRLLCDEVIWLKEGRIAKAGDTAGVVAAYENYLRDREELQIIKPPVAAKGDGAFPWISGVRISRGDETAGPGEFQTGEDLVITVEYEVPYPPTLVHVGIILARNDGVECFGTGTHVVGLKPSSVSGAARLRLPRIALLSGEYAVNVFLLDEHGLHLYDVREKEWFFRVVHRHQSIGLCYLDHRWEIETAVSHSSVVNLEQSVGKAG
jgi:ABC-type polysaccharide/polyol phosphate transport system ATPase subunit